jgi:hypothetical protein
MAAIRIESSSEREATSHVMRRASMRSAFLATSAGLALLQPSCPAPSSMPESKMILIPANPAMVWNVSFIAAAVRTADPNFPFPERPL